MQRVRLFLILRLLFIAAFVRGQSSFPTLFENSEKRGEATYSAIIADLETGKILGSFAKDRLLIPASTLKILTTASATLLLDDYPFITNVYLRGIVREDHLQGDLVIKSSGDPTLYSKYFPADSSRFRETLMVILANHGIKSIDGGVVIDASSFDKQGFNPLWEAEDRGEWYGCGVYGFNLFDNWIDLTFKTGKAGSKPTLLKTYPSSTGVVLDNRLRSVKKGAFAEAEGLELENKRTLKGTLLQRRSKVNLSIDLPHPPAFAADFITALLRSHGVSIKEEGRYTFAPIQDPGKLGGMYYGPRLPDLLRICNHFSLNHYAEALLKRIAQNRATPATTKEGILVEEELWKSLGVSLSKGGKVVDGSGLSRHNRLTASDLFAVLQGISLQGDRFTLFRQSLPEAGLEGSVKNFLKKTPYKAYLKSGSMRGVVCYAGYIRYKDRDYTVVLFANKVKNKSRVRKVMQNAIEAVVLSGEPRS